MIIPDDIVTEYHTDCGIYLFRQCKSCKCPQTEEEFGINPKTDKPYTNCGKCRIRKQPIEKQRDYIDKNRESLNQKRRNKYANNENIRERILEKNQKYAEANREKINEWRRNHPRTEEQKERAKIADKKRKEKKRLANLK